jgi:hypothetical protein
MRRVLFSYPSSIGKLFGVGAMLAFLVGMPPHAKADQMVTLSYSFSSLTGPVNNAYALLAQEGGGPSQANLAFVNIGQVPANTPYSGTLNLDFTTLGLTYGASTSFTLFGTTVGPNGHTNLVTEFANWLDTAATESSWSTMLGYYPLNYKLFINAMFNGTSVDQVAAAPAYWESQGYPQLVLPSADIFDTPGTIFPSVAWGTSPSTQEIIRYSDTGAVGQVMGFEDPSFGPATGNPVPEPPVFVLFAAALLLAAPRWCQRRGRRS